MLFLAGTLGFLGACEPIEDRDELSNTYNPDDIQVEVIQSSNGTGNGLTLKMLTPGVYGYWDYKLDVALTHEVSFVSPFMGEVEFSYYVSSPFIKGGDLSNPERIEKKVTVNVQVMDNDINPSYFDLTGEDLSGKTWVLDLDNADGRFYFMSDPGDPSALWWNAGQDSPPADLGGKLVFDLAGAPNLTYYADGDDEGKTGTFKFNKSFTKLIVGKGVNLLGASSHGSGNVSGEYTIVEMSSERMVLHTNSNGAGTGWTWVFVPAE